jgi:transposase
VYLLTIKKEVQLGKRRTYDDNFKARVALEAIKGEKTISEIAGQYEVHPNQIIQWKKRLLENVTDVFSKKKDPQIEEQEELIEELYKKIGRQNIELEFLKKKYRQLQNL